MGGEVGIVRRRVDYFPFSFLQCVFFHLIERQSEKRETNAGEEFPDISAVRISQSPSAFGVHEMEATGAKWLCSMVYVHLYLRYDYFAFFPFSPRLGSLFLFFCALAPLVGISAFPADDSPLVFLCEASAVISPVYEHHTTDHSVLPSPAFVCVCVYARPESTFCELDINMILSRIFLPHPAPVLSTPSLLSSSSASTAPENSDFDGARMCAAQSIERYAVEWQSIWMNRLCMCVFVLFRHFRFLFFLRFEPDVSRWSLMDNDDDGVPSLTTRTTDDYTHSHYWKKGVKFDARDTIVYLLYS